MSNDDPHGVAELAIATHHALAQLGVVIRALVDGASVDPNGVADELEAALGASPTNMSGEEAAGFLSAYGAKLREKAPEAHRLLFGIATALCVLLATPQRKVDHVRPPGDADGTCKDL